MNHHIERAPARSYHECIKYAMHLATELGFTTQEQARLFGYGTDDVFENPGHLEYHLEKMRSGDVRARCDLLIDVAEQLEMLSEGKNDIMRMILDAKHGGLRNQSMRELLLSLNAIDGQLAAAYLKNGLG